MRHIIESTGEQIKQVNWVSAMSICISALALLRAYEVLSIKVDNGWTLIIWAIVLLVCAILFVFCCQLVGSFLVWISEKIPASVEIVICPDSETAPQEVDRKTESVILGNRAVLKILNKESSELSNCYAVLKSRDSIPERSPFNITGKRLRWEDAFGDNESETTLAPRNGEALLGVYELAIDLSKNSITRSDFDTWQSGQRQMVTLRPVGVYNIEIELHGKIKGKDVKIRPFVGYVHVYVNQNSDETEFSINIYKGLYSGKELPIRGRSTITRAIGRTNRKDKKS